MEMETSLIWEEVTSTFSADFHSEWKHGLHAFRRKFQALFTQTFTVNQNEGFHISGGKLKHFFLRFMQQNEVNDFTHLGGNYTNDCFRLSPQTKQRFHLSGKELNALLGMFPATCNDKLFLQIFAETKTETSLICKGVICILGEVSS